MRKFVLAILLAAGAGAPVSANVIRTPQCAAKLTRAHELIHSISSRTYVTPPPSGRALCEILRTNLREMREARSHMNECMTGHERGENVGQMDVSMADIAFVLGQRCR